MTSVPSPFLEVALVLHVAFGFLLTGPQLVRLLRTRSPEGVSLTAYMNGCFSYFSWTSLFLIQGTWVVALTNTLASLPWMASTFILWRLRAGRSEAGKLGASTLPWVLACTAGMIGAALHPLAFLIFAAFLSCSVLWVYIPALVEVFRERNPVGVSLWTWALGVGEGICFALVGLPLLASLAYGLVASCLSLAVWSRVLYLRHLARPNLVDSTLPLHSY